MAEDYAADVLELKQLLKTAKRPRVQDLLRLKIESLESEVRVGATDMDVEDSGSPSDKPLEPGTTPASELKVTSEHVSASAAEKGLPVVQPLQKITKTLEPYYITLSSFGWDQELDRLKIYISLEGASKDKIVADFKSTSFELKIHDVGGKNYRCGVANLHKPVNPETAVITVKPKRIIVTLRKVQNNTWSDIRFKEDKFKNSLSKNDKDPMAGVMDLMKNMYEEGDDETKRTIAKAWADSRSGKKPDPMTDVM